MIVVDKLSKDVANIGIWDDLPSFPRKEEIEGLLEKEIYGGIKEI